MSLFPQDPNNIPPGQNVTPAFSALYLQGNGVVINKARLKNYPIGIDSQLNNSDNEQTVFDCTTITGWVKAMHTLITAAWSDEKGNVPVLFTQDYALLPRDPQDLKSPTIVHQILSKVPADLGSRQNGPRREIKPRVREVVYNPATAVNANTAVSQPASNGVTYIWGQSFDVIMAFTVYAATWSDMYKWLEKFEDFMVTYSAIFLQRGLQQITFREETRDSLFDPPRNEEFPNKSLYYNVRIERQTKTTYAEIEQILIKAGIVSPLTEMSGNTQLISVANEVESSPILPGANPSSS